MNERRLKKEILKYISKHECTSFAELETLFEQLNFEYKGDILYSSGSNQNIVFWAGWNQKAFNLISELKRAGKIEMTPCEKLVYVVDGKGLTLPIARNVNVKRESWLPVTFSVV